MYTSQDEQLAGILEPLLGSLDITPEEFAAAEARYLELADFLCTYWAETETDGFLYPQGSMRLGTVTRLIHRNDEYDLDMVCRRDLTRESITKADLKADVGGGLRRFVESLPADSPDLADEGKRCWTLKYPSRLFHLDVLPALPDPDAKADGIILTDTELARWQHSNPIKFADWFHGVMRVEWLKRAGVLAESRGMDIDEVPRWWVKTMLQRVVQALKRHRDIYFTQDLHNRPASVIITTLAAQAYRPGGTLYETLKSVAGRMPYLVAQVGGLYEVRNPVQKKENFADRWKCNPERAARFFQWMEQAHADFVDLADRRGVDQILTRAAAAFGDRAAKIAEKAYGTGLTRARTSGRLGVLPGAATLVAGGGRTVPGHRFHNDRARGARA